MFSQSWKELTSRIWRNAKTLMKNQPRMEERDKVRMVNFMRVSPREVVLSKILFKAKALTPSQ